VAFSTESLQGASLVQEVLTFSVATDETPVEESLIFLGEERFKNALKESTEDTDFIDLIRFPLQEDILSPLDLRKPLIEQNNDSGGDESSFAFERTFLETAPPLSDLVTFKGDLVGKDTPRLEEMPEEGGDSFPSQDPFEIGYEFSGVLKIPDAKVDDNHRTQNPSFSEADERELEKKLPFVELESKKKLDVFSRENVVSVPLRAEKKQESIPNLLQEKENNQSEVVKEEEIFSVQFEEKEIQKTEMEIKPPLSFLETKENLKNEALLPSPEKDRLPKGTEGGNNLNDPFLIFNSIPEKEKSFSGIGGASSSLPVFFKDVLDHSIGMMLTAKKDGSSFVRFQLHPESLGILEINLVFREEGLSIHFAGEPTTIELLQRHAFQLSQALHQEGVELNLDQMNFGFSSDQETTYPSQERAEKENSLLLKEKNQKTSLSSQLSPATVSEALSGRVNILIETSFIQLNHPGESTLCRV
jgi:hypothetical protein